MHPERVLCEVWCVSGMLPSGTGEGVVWGELSLQGATAWLQLGELLRDLLGSAANAEIKESALNGP